MSRENVVNKSHPDLDEYINELNEIFVDGVDVEYPAGIHCGHSVILNLTGQMYLEDLVNKIIKDVYANEKAKRDDFVNSAKYLNDVLTKTKEESKMTQQSNRRVVTVELIDDDPGLPVEHSIVDRYESVVTEDDNETTIRELIMGAEVAESLARHNETRAACTDLDVLKRTGLEVKLQPVKLKDLRWVVK